MPDTIHMPCLTLWQPWAAVVAAGLKTIENRPWAPPRSIRGRRIAIHAGRHYDDDLWEMLTKGIWQVEQRGLKHLLFERGSILATAVVAGYIWKPSRSERSKLATYDESFLGNAEIVTYGVLTPELKLKSDEIEWWMRDEYGWILRDIRLLARAFPARGHQGIWYADLPRELVEAPHA